MWLLIEGRRARFLVPAARVDRLWTSTDGRTCVRLVGETLNRIVVRVLDDAEFVSVVRRRRSEPPVLDGDLTGAVSSPGPSLTPCGAAGSTGGGVEAALGNPAVRSDAGAVSPHGADCELCEGTGVDPAAFDNNIRRPCKACGGEGST